MTKDEKEKDLDLEPDEEFKEFHSPDAYSFELDKTVEDESLGETDLNYYPKEFNAELDNAAKEVEEEEKKKKQEELIATKEAAVMAGASKVKLKSTKPVKKKKKAIKKKKKVIKKKIEDSKVIPKKKESKEKVLKIEEKEDEKKRIKIFSGKNVAIAASIIFILLVMTFVVFNAVSDAIEQQKANSDNSKNIKDEMLEAKETLENPVDDEIADSLFEKLKNKD